jgi:hypothetical protein
MVCLETPSSRPRRQAGFDLVSRDLLGRKLGAYGAGAGPGDAITPLLDWVNRNGVDSTSIRRAKRLHIKLPTRLVDWRVAQFSRKWPLADSPLFPEKR